MIVALPLASGAPPVPIQCSRLGAHIFVINLVCSKNAVLNDSKEVNYADVVFAMSAMCQVIPQVRVLAAIKIVNVSPAISGAAY